MDKQDMKHAFKIYSANANSIKNKLDSLRFIISTINPDVIAIQETKLKRKTQVSLPGFKCFPTLRGDNGGGVLIACRNTFKPVLIHEGVTECEIIVIEMRISHTSIRIIAGYGAQECAPLVVREAYRNSIEEQVSRAYLAGCSVIIAEDANAKLGPEMIPNDPHKMSDNGRLLAGMIERQSLSVVNASRKCIGGPVTRKRVVDGKLESSCIDYIIVSQDLEQLLTEANIDKDQVFALTKFTTTKGKPDVKKSDHFPLIANFNIEWMEKKRKREEIFRLRDYDGLRKFHEMTTNCRELTDIFKHSASLEEGCNKWYKVVEGILHRCFKKIKITNTPPKKTLDYNVYRCMNELKVMKELLSVSSDMHKPVLQREIETQELKVANLQGEKISQIMADNANLLQNDESFSSNNAWKLKKKMFPKCNDVPFALVNKKGELVTEYDGILDVMKDEFIYRLRNREINPEYTELKELKEYLCKLRLEITKRSNYNKW